MLQTYIALAGLWRHQAISTVTKVFYFSPEAAIIQWFLCCKSITSDNLPALLVSTLTSSHPLYLHSNQKTLSPVLLRDKLHRFSCR